jgi:hypothetical protein
MWLRANCRLSSDIVFVHGGPRRNLLRTSITSLFGPFQIEHCMNELACIEDGTHNQEMDLLLLVRLQAKKHRNKEHEESQSTYPALSCVGFGTEEMHASVWSDLDSVHPVKSREERLRILPHMSQIAWKNLPEELAFGPRDRLDHVLPIMAVEEELSTFRIRNELQILKIAADAQEVLGGIDGEPSPDLTENVGAVIFEFEITHGVRGSGGGTPTGEGKFEHLWSGGGGSCIGGTATLRCCFGCGGGLRLRVPRVRATPTDISIAVCPQG